MGVTWLQDTAGQERFRALGPIYYRDSNGAVLVYDITDADSFDRVKNWVKELRQMLGNAVALVIVGAWLLGPFPQRRRDCYQQQRILDMFDLAVSGSLSSDSR